ncbi:hypothetical protein RF11_13920 [Thelohanellus kitauei]|uniref:Uncharacterized protein n=1 Tax=Thelohanellus kitauei TaxID=669202 RepID=A0A0C2IVR7_THEKT|nr:hypothetical protein RF11_13920 [Thelohanellus kitauei]
MVEIELLEKIEKYKATNTYGKILESLDLVYRYSEKKNELIDKIDEIVTDIESFRKPLSKNQPETLVDSLGRPKRNKKMKDSLPNKKPIQKLRRFDRRRINKDASDD